MVKIISTEFFLREKKMKMKMRKIEFDFIRLINKLFRGMDMKITQQIASHEHENPLGDENWC